MAMMHLLVSDHPEQFSAPERFYLRGFYYFTMGFI